MKNILKCGVVFVMLNLCACTYYTAEVIPCDGQLVDRNISYKSDVSPIIGKTCALSGCHVTGFENGDFTSFDDIKKKADSGMLELMITTAQMPASDTQGPKSLTACEIELIKNWIKEGAVNN